MQHLYGNNRTYFITFRLADSLPQTKILELKNEYAYKVSLIIENDIGKKKELLDKIEIEVLGKYNEQLDINPYGKCILKDEKIAKIVSDQIMKYHDVLYELKCYSIMPNHVHTILRSRGDTPEDKSDPVNSWIKKVKGSSARLINIELNQTGTLWATESWDRMIRNEKHYHTAFYYTINNPHKAKLESKYSVMPYMW